MSASMLKQMNGGMSGFKGIDTVERLSRGYRMADMARNKSPPGAYGTSILNATRERNDKLKYRELLKQVCPDIYSKTISKDSIYKDFRKKNP